MEGRDILEFGAFRADARRKTLTRNGEVVALPAKAFDVLHALLRKPGQTIGKDELMKDVWPDTFVEEGNLTQMVFLLRKALGESDTGQALIVTVPRQGYRFVGTLRSFPAEVAPASPGTELPNPIEAIVSGPKSESRNTRNTWWIIAAVATVAGIGGWAIGRYNDGQRFPEPRLLRFTIAPEENTTYRSVKVSPDGRSLALMEMDRLGTTRLRIRRLDALGTQVSVAAEYWPFWSPDGRFVAFAHDGKLMKIDVSSGVQQTICSAPLVIGGTWSRNGTIIFGDGAVLSIVPAAGGEVQTLTQLNLAREETANNFPVFLPDGRHFLFTIHSQKKEYGGLFTASIDAPEARVRVLEEAANAEYVSISGGGYLLFPRNGVLMAQRFAADARQLKGTAFPVVDTISQDPVTLGASFSASQDVLAITGAYLGDQVTWYDRAGNRLKTVGKPGLHLYPELSPDGQTLIADVIDPERFASDIWLFPLGTETSQRFTLQGSCRAVWSPDGTQIAFESLNTGLYLKSFAGTESETLLLEGANPLDRDRLPCEWSRDNRFLIFSQRDEKTGFDLWALRLFGDRKPFALLHTEHNEWCGTLSPDVKWIAYASDESGRSEIWVQAFAEESGRSSRKWQISNDGGSWPKWRRDGKELLYLSGDRKIVAVEVTAGATFQHGAPRPLFASGIRTPDARFDVTADGSRLIIPSRTTDTNSAPATVILNWTAGADR